MNSYQPNTLRGTSLLDVLVTVSVIGLLGTLAIIKLGDIPEASREARLRSQKESLNASIQLYLGSGGSMAGVLADGIDPPINNCHAQTRSSGSINPLASIASGKGLGENGG